MDLRREVLELVERHLDDLSISFWNLSPEELLSRFGRRSVSQQADSFELVLDGVPGALTVTVLDEEEAEDYGPVRAVSEEVGRVEESGRPVAYHQVILAPLGTILLDLVRDHAGHEMGPDRSDQEFLAELLDHETVLPLLTRPEQPSANGRRPDG